MFNELSLLAKIRYFCFLLEEFLKARWSAFKNSLIDNKYTSLVNDSKNSIENDAILDFNLKFGFNSQNEAVSSC